MTETKKKYIKRKLTAIHSQVTVDKEFNLQDINVEAEEIFRQVLNATYSWNLIDANKKIKNFPAIDLIDESKKIVLQVTSSLGTAKINDTLKGFNKFKEDEELKMYANYRLIFCYILKEKEVRTDKFLKDRNLQNNNFIDINDILEKIDETTENSVYEVLKNIYVEDKIVKELAINVDDGVTGIVKNDGTVTQNITNNYNSATPQKKDPKHLTSLPPINTNFIGREDDLKTIERNLSSDNVVCVVNGIGGVGKSELSYRYLHEHKEKYNKIAFIEFTEESRSLEETFYFKFQDTFQLTEKDTLETIIKRLQGLKPKNLMVLDNLQSNEDFNKIKALNTNFDLLITTRAKFDSPNILNLETLNNDDAKELFLTIYKTTENIDSILKYLDNHPLFITLTAYSLNEEYIELDELRADIASGKVTEIDSKDDKTFQEHLHDTFDRQFKNEQNSELKAILQILALFPAIEIEFEMLKKIIVDKKLKVKLQKLVARGWLSKKENSYKLHQIIKTFILTSYPAEYEDVTFVLENIGNYIDPDDNALIASQLSDYIPMIDSLLELFRDKKDEPIAKILDSNTYLYFSLRDYDNSLKMQKDSLKIREVLYDEKSKLLALNYILLGVIYQSKRENTKAEPLYKKSLEIYKRVLGENHTQIASIYDKLASLYSERNQYSQAKKLYEKSLKISKKILGESHHDTASSYNNLGSLYESKGENTKAEFFYRKALDIYEETLESSHPFIAINYSNLANLYNSIGEYNKAKSLYEKALKIREEILGENHPDTANSYKNLGLFYKDRKECTKANEYLEKAIASVKELEYADISLIDLSRALREVEKSMAKEKKAKFNKKGKFCVATSLSTTTKPH